MGFQSKDEREHKLTLGELTIAVHKIKNYDNWYLTTVHNPFDIKNMRLIQIDRASAESEAIGILEKKSTDIQNSLRFYLGNDSKSVTDFKLRLIGILSQIEKFDKTRDETTFEGLKKLVKDSLSDL